MLLAAIVILTTAGPAKADALAGIDDARALAQREMIGQRFGATVGLVRAGERLVADTVLRIT